MKKTFSNTRIIVVLIVVFIMIGAWIDRLNRVDIHLGNFTSSDISLKPLDEKALYILSGTWEYFPDRLASEIPEGIPGETVTVDHIWPRNSARDYAYGVATYRLTLNGLDPQRIYGLYVQDEASAYRLSVNGRLVVATGSVSRDPKIYQADIYSDTGTFVSDATGRAVLVMEIANYSQSDGGFYHAPILGETNTIQRYFSTLFMVEVFILASVLTLGLLFVVMANTGRERSPFYMAWFSLFMALRILTTGVHLIQYILPAFPYYLQSRLEYASGHLLLPVFGLLLESFDFGISPPFMKKLYLAMIPVYSIGFLVAPDHILQLAFSLTRIIMVPYAIYLMYFLIRAYKEKHAGMAYLSVGILVMALGVIAFLYGKDVRFAMPFASMVFLLMFSIYVVLRFAVYEERRVRLETEVLTDPLTRTLNRQALFKALEERKPVAPDQQRHLLFLDLDRFKPVNDQYGHEVGDQVLILVAERIRHSCRESDRLYRIGGDEFVILADIAQGFDVAILVERIRNGIREPFIIGELQVEIGVSIGVERFDPQTDALNDVILRADQKMYEDKRRLKTA